MGDDAHSQVRRQRGRRITPLVGLDLDLDEGWIPRRRSAHRAARTGRRRTHPAAGCALRCAHRARAAGCGRGRARRAAGRACVPSPACPAARSCGRRAPLDSTAPVARSLSSWTSSVSIRFRGRLRALAQAGVLPGQRLDRSLLAPRPSQSPAEIGVCNGQRLRQRLPDRPKPGKLGLKCLPDRAKLGRLNRQRRFPGLQLPHGPAQTGVLLAQHVHRRLLAPRSPQGRTQLGSLVERQLRQRRPGRPKLGEPGFNFSLPALDTSRAWRSQKTSSDSDRARASASPSILTSR